MTQFLFSALATFTAVIFVLACLPFRVPPKFNTVLTTAVAYGTLELYRVAPLLVEAAAIATIVAALSRFVVTELPKPWSWDNFVGHVLDFQLGVSKRVRGGQAQVSKTLRSKQAQVRHHLQNGSIGNRIPKL